MVEEISNGVPTVMGATKDEALRYVIPFGKYEGKTLGEIYDENPGYLNWMLETFSIQDRPKLVKYLIVILGESGDEW